MHWGLRLRQAIEQVENTLLVGLLGGMMLVGMWQIVARNLFQGGFADAEPLMRMAVLWLGLVGALVASRYHQHIAIDLSEKFLPQKFLRPVQALTFGFTAFISALLAYHSGRFVMDEADIGTTFIAGLPIWPFEIIMPIAFGLIALRYATHALFGLPKKPTSP